MPHWMENKTLYYVYCILEAVNEKDLREAKRLMPYLIAINEGTDDTSIKWKGGKKKILEYIDNIKFTEL